MTLKKKKKKHKQCMSGRNWTSKNIRVRECSPRTTFLRHCCPASNKLVPYLQGDSQNGTFLFDSNLSTSLRAFVLESCNITCNRKVVPSLDFIHSRGMITRHRQTPCRLVYMQTTSPYWLPLHPTDPVPSTT